jgi:hypothetical protein
MVFPRAFEQSTPMSEGSQYHQETFFKVGLWHLLAMAALFTMADWAGNP